MVILFVNACRVCVCNLGTFLQKKTKTKMRKNNNNYSFNIFFIRFCCLYTPFHLLLEKNIKKQKAFFFSSRQSNNNNILNLFFLKVFFDFRLSFCGV